jgi:hypothetical protein
MKDIWQADRRQLPGQKTSNFEFTLVLHGLWQRVEIPLPMHSLHLPGSIVVMDCVLVSHQ